MDRNKMKAIRLFFGESQAAFARRLGVAATTINEIERGKREMSDLIKAKLIRLENELPDEFFNFYVKLRKIS